MSSVFIPTLDDRERASWLGLAKIAEVMPEGWTLVGGNLTRLHAIERGVAPRRATTDIDIVLDVRARPGVVGELVLALRGAGFAPELGNPSGRDHRWTDGSGKIDVMVPIGLREVFVRRRHDGLGYVLETRGAQVAANRSERVLLEVAGQTFTVNRPDLVGALYAKCSALLILTDTDRSRHYEDIAALSSMVREKDMTSIMMMRGRERRRLVSGITRAARAQGDASMSTQMKNLARKIEDPAWIPASMVSTRRPERTPPPRPIMCGARTASGAPCRNLRESCPHHR